jgi:hypothetical protein
MPLKKSKNPTTSDPSVSPPPSPWRNSTAKARLRGLLKDKSSWVQSCTAQQAWESDPGFKRYRKDRFVTNFNNLKEAIGLENEFVDFDNAAFNDHNRLFPRNATTERGEPFWDTHPAKKLLEEDVKLGRVSNRQPKDIQQDFQEYKDFKPSTFRNFLHHEIRRQREEVYWQKKRNDQSAETHRKEVVEA